MSDVNRFDILAITRPGDEWGARAMKGGSQIRPQVGRGVQRDLVRVMKLEGASRRPSAVIGWPRRAERLLKFANAP